MSPRRKRRTDAEKYEKAKESAHAYSRRRSAAGRDIGAIRKLTKSEKRTKQAFSKSLKKFALTCFPKLFFRKFSKAHLDLIKAFEAVVNEGTQQAYAMPRGSGKTTIATVAILWAIVTGKRRYCLVLACNGTEAKKILENMMTLIEISDPLNRYYPEVCQPIRALEGLPMRAKGQTCEGEQTKIQWAGTKIVFPSIKGSASSGSVVKCSGIDGGGIRGTNHVTQDGVNLRPDIVFADDLQNNKTAKSPIKCSDIHENMEGQVKGIVGEGETLAMIQTGTVIKPDDYFDQVLNHDINPDWNGVRVSMLDPMPKNMDLWAEYNAARLEEKRTKKKGIANRFYKKHRKKLDEGAKAYCDEITLKTEVSAIQHAMNLYFDNQASFWAERQNRPQVEEAGDSRIVPEDVLKKMNGFDRYWIPTQCDTITMMIDIHKDVLYYTICAFEEKSFSGYVIDYGTYPEQPDNNFRLASAKNTLGKTFPGMNEKAYVLKGLEVLEEMFFSRIYTRADGHELLLDLCLIDARYNVTDEVVYEFCYAPERRRILYPSLGEGVKATNTSYAERSKKDGVFDGHNWKLKEATKKYFITPRIIFDTNYWKSFASTRIKTEKGIAGSMELFGSNRFEHLGFANHLTSEVPKLVTAGKRTVEEWFQKPNTQNHWFDCFVGCFVAASILGVELPWDDDDGEDD
jgi:hypothetical protein